MSRSFVPPIVSLAFAATLGLMIAPAGVGPRSLSADEPASSRSQLGDGLILIAPLSGPDVYLVNAAKQIVHTWRCGGGPGNAAYLLEDGSLLHTGRVNNPAFRAQGGVGGSIRKLSWDSEPVWEYRVADESMHAHHDVEPMPNGNVLVIAWEQRSRDEALAAGRDPTTMFDDSLWPETILELQPQGRRDAKVVWQWRLWDHLVQRYDRSKANYGDVAAHPELVDINYGSRRGGADWIHMNAIDYNAELDQIAMSARWFDEVWIIDHGTTTKEAAGHRGGKQGRGGDLLYRWGNPDAYFGGFPIDRQFFAQHDVRWIDRGCPGAGNLLLFNNGDRRADRNYSSVDELVPPLTAKGAYRMPKAGAFEPQTFEWSYSDSSQFLSNRISGAQRLPGGNTLICSGDQGWVFEVTPEGERVWELRLEDLDLGGRRAGLFRAPYYPADHAAFSGRALAKP